MCFCGLGVDVVVYGVVVDVLVIGGVRFVVVCDCDEVLCEVDVFVVIVWDYDGFFLLLE